MGAALRADTTGLRPWVRAALRCGAALAAAVLALPLGGAAYAAPDPAPTLTVSPGADPLAAAKTTLGPMLDRLHQLYQDAEKATEQYDAAKAKLAQQQAAVVDLQAQVVQQQAAVDAGSDLAAQLAAAQYRNQNASEYAQLLLADNPYEAVTIAQLLQEAGRSQKAFLDRLKLDRDALTASKQQAEQAVAQSQALAAQQAQAQADTAKRLADVEQLVGSLTGAQRSDLEQLEKQEADQAQLAFLASGALGKGERTPSKAGRAAVAFALAQLGKDYEWGAEGPQTYDCSGLTSQAWLHAGHPIPRTSQEQWAELTHIPLNQIRPGDLVVYFEGATHVGMYIGGGLIVQAPHTGAVIKVSQMGAMPILGAVRPDPESVNDDQGGTWQIPSASSTAGTVTPIQPSKPTTLPTPPASPSPSPSAPAPSTPPASPKPSATPSTQASPTPDGSPSSSPSSSSSASNSASPSPSPSAS